jgi:predicted dehydrogenase
MLKKQNKNQIINVGLIGYGYWAPNIAKNLTLNPKINLKWICDKNVDRIEKAKSIYASQVKYSDDSNKIINDPTLDAIVIGVETSSHYSLVKQALNMGKHVFVEKPFTSTVEEAIELEELAKKTSLKIHVNHIMVYNSGIKKIKNLLSKNHIGDILYIDAMRMNLGQIRKDVSAMWDLALHDLVIIDYLTEGKEPYFISAMGEKYYNPKESVSFLTMRYEGFISHIQSSWISPLKERKLIIVGSKKMIVFDDLKIAEKLTIYDKGVNVISGKNIEYGNYEVKTHEGDVWSPYIENSDALYDSIDNFRKAIEENKKPITGSDQAIRIQRILKKADERMNK